MQEQCTDVGPKGRVFNTKSPRKWFTAALEEAGITDYGWHCNRHTFCSRLARNGKPMTTIQKLAGHKTISTSARYIKTDEEQLQDGVDGIF